MAYNELTFEWSDAIMNKVLVSNFFGKEEDLSPENLKFLNQAEVGLKMIETICKLSDVDPTKFPIVNVGILSIRYGYLVDQLAYVETCRDLSIIIGQKDSGAILTGIVLKEILSKILDEALNWSLDDIFNLQFSKNKIKERLKCRKKD